jgi:hypothetical protein
MNIVIMARFVSKVPVQFQCFLIAGPRMLSLRMPKAEFAPRLASARVQVCR